MRQTCQVLTLLPIPGEEQMVQAERLADGICLHAHLCSITGLPAYAHVQQETGLDSWQQGRSESTPLLRGCLACMKKLPAIGNWNVKLNAAWAPFIISGMQPLVQHKACAMPTLHKPESKITLHSESGIDHSSLLICGAKTTPGAGQAAAASCLSLCTARPLRGGS